MVNKAYQKSRILTCMSSVVSWQRASIFNIRGTLCQYKSQSGRSHAERVELNYPHIRAS